MALEEHYGTASAQPIFSDAHFFLVEPETELWRLNDLKC
jgi:hypothetical protein